jgi:NADH:ubiquinone oxidoreductase subunit E
VIAAHGHDPHALVQILRELQALQGWLPRATLWQAAQALGLTLAQTFVQQHQGTVEYESEPGQTIFKIVIPLP